MRARIGAKRRVGAAVRRGRTRRVAGAAMIAGARRRRARRAVGAALVVGALKARKNRATRRRRAAAAITMAEARQIKGAKPMRRARSR